MTYIEAHLLHDEKIVYKARIHLLLFLQPLVLIALGYICYADGSNVNRVLGIALLVVGLSGMVQRMVIKLGAEYAVTTHRLVFKTGVVGRSIRELQHRKIEGVAVSQGVFGRIFGYGSVLVTTGGAVNTYTYIANPLRFRSAINQCIENSRLRHINNQ